MSRNKFGRRCWECAWQCWRRRVTRRCNTRPTGSRTRTARWPSTSAMPRARWVAPEGVIYTSSRWDENGAASRSTRTARRWARSVSTTNSRAGRLPATRRRSSSRWLQPHLRQRLGRPLRSQYEQTRPAYPGQHVDGPPEPGRDHRPRDGRQPAVRERFLRQPRARLYDRRRLAARHRRDRAWRAGARCGGQPGVARMSAGVVAQYSATGTLLNTIQMAAGARRRRCISMRRRGSCWWAKCPDMNIKLYSLAGLPQQIGTFGVQGGYLDTTSGIKGRRQRFTRVVGIGKDSGGNLYVLNNAWGGGWDLGRNGSTDLHSYSPTGALQWKLQALNFEAIAAPDPATDGTFFYSGNNVYTGSAGGTFVANTVDPFTLSEGPAPRHERLPARPAFRPARDGGRQPDSRRVGPEPRQLQFITSRRRPATSRIRPARCRASRSTRRCRSRPVSTSTATATWAGLNGTNAITRTR